TRREKQRSKTESFWPPSDLQRRWSLSEQQRKAVKFGGQWPRVSKPTCEARYGR
ncbi:hypothetical protein A2U01_0118173, partial [Trifolium medium]|nr:hypothetical protein [Trifolium medium]